MEISDIEIEKFKLQGSFLDFIQIFYYLRTGRPFVVSSPIGRESHHITIIKELVKVLNGETKRLIINVPPRYSKTELLIHFVAWSLSIYPDSNFIYVSYSHSLAKKQTQTIKQIIELPLYRKIMGVELRGDTQAKDNFETIQGGSVYAVGSQGTITGRGSGIQGVNRFGGIIVLDDLLKPDEATSDTVREGINEWYFNTLQSRVNSPDTPIVLIGQRLHEDDICSRLINTGEWKTLIIPAIDGAGNALNPAMHNLKTLLKMKEESPYVFAAQYMQDPQPSGGGIFKKEWFRVFEYEPSIISTFITCDSAETDKDYNDATVFSFWGLYKVKNNGIETDKYAIHWLDCLEIRVEPKDLQNEFTQFYRECMRHRIKPTMIAIEKKSTGVTLLSVLKDFQGVQLIPIERTKASGSKTSRFLEAQPYVSSGLVSLPEYGKHTDMCIEHCRKITANDSHRFDDVCFIAGTKIATLFGYKNIENMKVGDRVITPFGIRKVLSSGLTKRSYVINNIGLIGTDNHPIYSKYSFKRLDTICDVDKISYLSFQELFRWRYLKLLCLMESNISLQGRDDIILAGKKTIEKEKVLKDCMLQFMNFIAVKKYLRATLFITKIMIILIMTLIIWNVFHVSNILRFIRSKGKDVLVQIKNWNILRILEKKQKNGIEVKMEENGIVKMLKQVSIKLMNLPALFAIKNLMLNQQKELFAVQFADQSLGEKELLNSKLNALSVEMNLLENMPFQDHEVERHVLQYVKQEQDVYNITVEKDHVYYANNVLVSNCDTMYDAIKLALIDKVVMRKVVGSDYSDVGKRLYSISNKVNTLKQKAYK